jgi:hypothetical protein
MESCDPISFYCFNRIAIVPEPIEPGGNPSFTP